MSSNYKKLGDYIQAVNKRNKNIITEDLRGLSMSKEFRESTSNIVGTDLSKYKLVYKNQFACDFMSVIRVHKLPVVLHTENQPIIVSPAYTVFEVIDTDKLHPDYLMMWFRRSEFDRYADFRCDSAIRGGFKWGELCEVELPIPSIEKQREIVKEYNTVTNRIKLNEQLNQKLEETAQALYKHWFVDFEFPNEEGKPYKSSGGEMVYNEELDKEIPVRWSVKSLSELYKFQYGKGNNNPDNSGRYPIYGSNGIIGGYDKYNNEDSPVIGHIGINAGIVVYAFGKHYVTYNGVMCFLLKNDWKWFSYLTLCSIDLMSQTRGSSQPFVSYDMLYENLVVIPRWEKMDVFEKHIAKAFKRIENNKIFNQTLQVFQNLLLAKMTKVEETTKIC